MKFPFLNYKLALQESCLVLGWRINKGWERPVSNSLFIFAIDKYLMIKAGTSQWKKFQRQNSLDLSICNEVVISVNLQLFD